MCAISIKLLIYIYKLQILKPYIAIFNFHICNILKIGRKLLGGTNTSYTEQNVRKNMYVTTRKCSFIYKCCFILMLLEVISFKSCTGFLNLSVYHYNTALALEISLRRYQ